MTKVGILGKDKFWWDEGEVVLLSEEKNVTVVKLADRKIQIPGTASRMVGQKVYIRFDLTYQTPQQKGCWLVENKRT